MKMTANLIVLFFMIMGLFSCKRSKLEKEKFAILNASITSESSRENEMDEFVRPSDVLDFFDPNHTLDQYYHPRNNVGLGTNAAYIMMVLTDGNGVLLNAITSMSNASITRSTDFLNFSTTVPYGSLYMKMLLYTTSGGYYDGSTAINGVYVLNSYEYAYSLGTISDTSSSSLSVTLSSLSSAATLTSSKLLTTGNFVFCYGTDGATGTGYTYGDIIVGGASATCASVFGETSLLSYATNGSYIKVGNAQYPTSNATSSGGYHSVYSYANVFVGGPEILIYLAGATAPYTHLCAVGASELQTALANYDSGNSSYSRIFIWVNTNTSTCSHGYT